MTRLWLLFALGLVAVAGQQQDGFTISGTVVEHQSNRPLNHVLVTIRPTDRKGEPISFLTDADGQFRFSNVPAGKYRLGAQKRGQNPQLYQQNDGYSTAIVAGSGLVTDNIVFPIISPGSITGTVFDENGDPLQGAQIWLFRKAVVNGKAGFTQTATAGTGSTGIFYQGHLAPGIYVAAVTAHPWYARPGNGQTPANPELDVAYPITYYGGASAPAAAAPIALQEGGTAKIEIALHAVPSVHANLSEGVGTGQGMGVMMFAEGPGGAQIPVNGQVSTGGDGENSHYELSGIAPGRYTMRRFGQQGPSDNETSVVDLAGNSSVIPQGLPLPSVTGKLTLEGSDLPKAPGVVFNCGGSTTDANVWADGSFHTQIAQARSKRCEVRLANAPGFHINSVEVKGGGTTVDTIDLSSGTDLELTVAASQGGFSELRGTAVQDEKPLAGAMVLLIPQDASRATLIRRDQSDSDGTFVVREIRPGHYTLLAINEGKDFAYQESGVLKPYLAGGTYVDLPQAEETVVKVNVLKRKD